MDHDRSFGPLAHTVRPFRREDIEETQDECWAMLGTPAMRLAIQVEYLLFLLDELGWDGTARPKGRRETRKRWTPEEDRILMATSAPNRELAAQFCVTTNAIKQRRANLREQQQAA